MQRSMRIAFLSEHASPLAMLGGVDAGGQNVYVDEVCQQLSRMGYEVDVFTRRDNAKTEEIVHWAPGVRVIHLIAGPAEDLPKDELWPFMPAFRDALLNFIAISGTAYDIIHSNFWMSGWVAIELRRSLGIPAVHIFHALGTTKRRHQGNMDRSPTERIAIEMAIVQQVERLIAQCPDERDQLIQDYHADPQKIALIPAAVNTDIFRPVVQSKARRTIGLDKDGFVIVYVGRMLPRKDVGNIVRALPHLLSLYKSARPDAPPPKITLLIVGGQTAEPDPGITPEIGVLQKLAAELGVSQHIRLVGKRQHNTLRYYYSAGDIVVTTPWYEPFGLTPLEGMACGRPVIGAAVGGLPYTIVEEVTGLLVPPRDPQALAEQLYRLWQQPTLCNRLGRSARQRVEQQFVWSKVAERVADLYETMQMDRLLAPLPSLTAASVIADSQSR